MDKRKYFFYTFITCMILSIHSLLTVFAGMTIVNPDDYYSGPAGELIYAADLDWKISNEENLAEAIASKTGRGRLLGSFKTTAYCSDPRGGATGKTATGTVPRINHTVAANFREIAPGTRIMLEGSDVIYTVEDTGNYTNLIDVFLGSYDECIQYGVQYRNVYLVED